MDMLTVDESVLLESKITETLKRVVFHAVKLIITKKKYEKADKADTK